MILRFISFPIFIGITKRASSLSDAYAFEAYRDCFFHHDTGLPAAHADCNQNDGGGRESDLNEKSDLSVQQLQHPLYYFAK